MKSKGDRIAALVACLYLLSQWGAAVARAKAQAETPVRVQTPLQAQAGMQATGPAGTQTSTQTPAQNQTQAEAPTGTQTPAHAQVQLQPEARVYRSVKSSTSFFSDAPIEDIKAGNDGGASVLNAGTGEIVFLVPIRGFRFQKSLMQEHFNENYLESDRYPTATFKGKILDFKGLTTGRQEVRARGLLNIHGVERQVTVSGSIEKTDGGLHLLSKFKVKLEDHAIRIPRIVIRNIAEVVEVSLDYYYKPEEL